MTLANTALSVLIATINGSIVLISLPGIFTGIRLDPLRPGNVSYLRWMPMGYLLITAVLVVALGRLGDMRGQVKLLTPPLISRDVLGRWARCSGSQLPSCSASSQPSRAARKPNCMRFCTFAVSII